MWRLKSMALAPAAAQSCTPNTPSPAPITRTMRSTTVEAERANVSVLNSRAQGFYSHLGFRELTRAGSGPDECLYVLTEGRSRGNQDTDGMLLRIEPGPGAH